MSAQREWFEKDYYATLGVSEAAPDKEITRAYKKLAKQHHPDANEGDPTAAERFKDISTAYKILHDAEQRAEYDHVRQLVRQGVAGPGGGRPGFGPGFGGASSDGVHFEFTDGDPGEFGDLFSSLFGGRGPGPRSGVHGRDVETEVTISFDEAVSGITKAVRFSIGAGAPSQEVKVKIPAGIENGKRLRVRGKGESGQRGGQAGDLFVVVHVLPHSLFGRAGADLTLDLPVSFAEAAMGADVLVPTLNGEVRVRVPAGTPSGKVLRVRGRGLAKQSGGAGDLLVTLVVAVPSELSDEQRDAVRNLAAVFPDDPRASVQDRHRQDDQPTYSG